MGNLGNLGKWWILEFGESFEFVEVSGSGPLSGPVKFVKESRSEPKDARSAQSRMVCVFFYGISGISGISGSEGPWKGRKGEGGRGGFLGLGLATKGFRSRLMSGASCLAPDFSAFSLVER